MYTHIKLYSCSLVAVVVVVVVVLRMFLLFSPSSISHTTRPQRNEEQDGREYYFIDVETFSAAEEAVSVM